jgi:Tfp pilus assembly protein FimV
MAAVMATAMVNPAPHETQPTLPRPRLTVVPPAPVVRRRRVVAAAVLLVAIVLATLAASRVATVLGGAPASAPGHRVDTYVVQAGDTLWGIARRVQPEGDVRSLVDRLVRANGGPDLTVGRQLALP